MTNAETLLAKVQAIYDGITTDLSRAEDALQSAAHEEFSRQYTHTLRAVNQLAEWANNEQTTKD